MGLISGLASYGGASIGTVLQEWESLGVFAYVLPFILIFAVVFAVMDNIKVFEGRKGINMVIALAVALLSLQFNFVSVFFSEIFPRMGIGLSVILVGLILAGSFLDWNGDGKGVIKWVFFGLGALIFLIVVGDSFSSFSIFGGGWWQNYGSAVIILLLVAAMIVAVMVSKDKHNSK